MICINLLLSLVVLVCIGVVLILFRLWVLVVYCFFFFSLLVCVYFVILGLECIMLGVVMSGGGFAFILV